ncbi:Senescence-specific cysteine protease SAG39 [Euphorbia peplus]|nr:Senescence-specific cysteine protease SAG39 [Euphorbia peplus]
MNFGITSLPGYPFRAMVGSCRSSFTLSVATNTSYRFLPISEDIFLDVNTRKPNFMTVNADSPKFLRYTDGVHYEEYNFEEVNHAMMCTRFATEDDGTKFWWLNNSYGTS